MSSSLLLFFLSSSASLCDLCASGLIHPAPNYTDRARPMTPLSATSEPAPAPAPIATPAAEPSLMDHQPPAAAVSSSFFAAQPRRHWRWLALAILALAALLRLWQLDLRPPHFDEGVNGMFTDRMLTSGYYKYDPKNYHGPLHFYALLLFKVLFGRNLWALRLPTALVSLAAVGLTLKFHRFFGRPVACLAALGLALSPACVYYGRDAIHESWLLFFLLLTLYGIYGIWRDNRRADLWALGLGLTGAVLTKETYLIHFTCFLAAGCVLLVWETLLPSHTSPTAPPEPEWGWKDALTILAVCVGLIVFFYSGTFFNPAGLQGLFTTFTSWAHKSVEGEGHRKFWHYWLRLLWRREAWALVGLVAGVAWLAWSRRDWRLRYLAIYGTGTLVAYSIVPYKTPWCIMSIVWPFFFCAAAALVDLARVGKSGLLAAGCALAALVGWTSWQAWLVNFRHYADEDEPYSYVQTDVQVREIVAPLLALARESPTNYHRPGLVLSNSPHPLPWLLGDFSGVGYFYLPRKPADYNVDFLVVADDRIGEAEAQLKDRYYRQGGIVLRPALGPMTLYLRASVFAHQQPAGRVPEFDPAEGVVSVGPPQKEGDNGGGESSEEEADADEEGAESAAAATTATAKPKSSQSPAPR